MNEVLITDTRNFGTWVGGLGMHAPSLRVSGGLEMVFCDMQVFCAVQLRLSFPWPLVDGW